MKRMSKRCFRKPASDRLRGRERESDGLSPSCNDRWPESVASAAYALSICSVFLRLGRGPFHDQENTGQVPSEQLMSDMGGLIEDLTGAGQLISTAGCRASMGRSRRRRK